MAPTEPLNAPPQYSYEYKHQDSAQTNELHASREKEELSAEEKETVSNSDAEETENTTHHVYGIARIILVFGLCVTTFLIGLDQLIIATAIPKITSLFHSLGDVGWYGSAYLLCTTSLQPSFGKIYTYFDVKWTYVVALVIFELGSILCAAATSSKMFIVGRAVAGTGAAGLYGGGMTMIAYAIPLKQRSIYMACLSSMFGIASIVGPILGGVFTDKLSWRWCFWINLPFGVVGLIIIIFFFKTPARDFSHVPFGKKIKNMDLPGAFFLITGITCLLLALQWGGKSCSDSRLVSCVLTFV